MAVGWEGSRRPGQNSSQGMDSIILLPPRQQKAGPRDHPASAPALLSTFSLGDNILLTTVSTNAVKC